MDDRTLIRLLRRDPDAGLRAALQGYGPLVKAILMRVLPRDPREVEEGMADAFVALWRRAAELERDRTPVRPWLAVTARHIAIDRYRALRRPPPGPAAAGFCPRCGGRCWRTKSP